MHLRKTAEVNFNFQTPIETSGHHAKTLTSTKLQCLLSPWHMLGEPRQQCASCSQCRVPQRVRNVRNLQPCGYWRLPVCCAFAQSVSTPRIFSAAIVHESLRGTRRDLERISSCRDQYSVVGGTICVFTAQTHGSTRRGTEREAQGEDDERVGDNLGTVGVDDSGRRRTPSCPRV